MKGYCAPYDAMRIKRHDGTATLVAAATARRTYCPYLHV
jgi:hypothetical protein